MMSSSNPAASKGIEPACLPIFQSSGLHSSANLCDISVTNLLKNGERKEGRGAQRRGERKGERKQLLNTPY